MAIPNKAGYTDKSLAQKLGLKTGMRAIVLSPPPDYYDWIGDSASIINDKQKPPYDFIHLFTNEVKDLEDQLFRLKSLINSNGMIWVSWYKKSAKKPTELTEDIIRETCLALGLVDVKVCAVSEDWSGLKLVIPLSKR